MPKQRFAKKMQIIQETIEGLRLESFEERLVSFVAVGEVHGERHPLLAPGRVDGSLSDGLGLADDEGQVFEGEDAGVIHTALETIAENSDSSYKQAARWMLGMEIEKEEGPVEPIAQSAEPDSVELEAMSSSTQPIAAISRDREPNRVHAIEMSKEPHIEGGVVVDGHIELTDLPELTTALHSVRNFDNSEAGEIIRQDIADHVKESRPESIVFWGSSAKIIYDSLKRAAERDKTLFDASAAHMLKVGEEAAERTRLESAREQVSEALPEAEVGLEVLR